VVGGGVVACDVFRQDPVRGVRVEKRVEGYEVCFFAYAPGVLVFVVCGGRFGVVVRVGGAVTFATWR